MTPDAAGTPISDQWLKDTGFKWHQLERQPTKHWLLWLGAAIRRNGLGFVDDEDLGIEISNGGWPGREQDWWFCWLRSDTSHRYGRFIHIRHVRTAADVIQLVEAFTGQPWDPSNHLYGSVRTPENAALIREADNRLDRRLMAEGHPWREQERDPTIGRPLLEHLEAHEKAKKP